jgi:hypothetical protein
MGDNARLLRLPSSPSYLLLFRPAMYGLSQEHPTYLACSMSFLQISADTANGIPRAFGVWTASAPMQLNGMTVCLHLTKGAPDLLHRHQDIELMTSLSQMSVDQMDVFQYSSYSSFWRSSHSSESSTDHSRSYKGSFSISASFMLVPRSH